MALHGTRLAEALASLDLITGNTTEQCTDVITGFCEIKSLSEHLNTGNDNCSGIIGNTDDLDGIVELEGSSLDTARCNGTTSGDGEDILNRHQERLVVITNRIRDVGINRIHQLHDLVAPRAVRILKSLQSGAADDRGIIARESVLVQKVTDLHFDKLEQLIVIDHIALVQEHNDVRNTDLTCKKNVLSGLCHDTIGRCDNEDSAVHLCCAGDHVLDIVSMSGAVNMSVMSLLGLILDVRGVDCDSSCSLFRSLIDLIECDSLIVAAKSLGKDKGDCSGKSGLAVVNMADRADIYMGLGPVKMLFCHFTILLRNNSSLQTGP